MPRFVISRPNEPTRVFELSGDRPISIGRAKSSSIMLDDVNISRLHAVVLRSPGGQWQIVDRGSVNGIQVNGKPVKEAALHPNDELVLGDHHLRFEEGEATGFVVHDTTRLPDHLVQEIRRTPSPYSGSFLPVVPVAGPAPAEAKPEARRKEVASRERDLQRENALLTLLLRVNRALSELQNVNVVAERVLDVVLEIEGVERGYAMLLDEASMGERDFSQGDYSFQPAILRTRGDAMRADGKPQPKLIISQTIVGKVMESGLPLLLADAQAPEGKVAASRSLVSAGVLSAMCAPLGGRDRCFGLLYVDSPTRRSLFTQETLDIFAVIAAQAGQAIDRVRTQDLLVALGQTPTLKEG